jgi:tetratricopeptide (TPR) repeat protein
MKSHRNVMRILSLMVFIIFIILLFGKVGFGDSLEESSPYLSNDSFVANVQRMVKELDYPHDVCQLLSRAALEWKCDYTWHRLEKDRLISKNVPERMAEAERSAIREIYDIVGKNIVCEADANYDLKKILSNKHANCFGYSQLFYVLYTSMGLKCRYIVVVQDALSRLKTGESHAACLIELNDGKSIIVDRAYEYDGLTDPFKFEDKYKPDGNVYRLREENSFGIIGFHKIIRITKNGLLANLSYGRGQDLPDSQDAKRVEFYTKAIDNDPELASAYTCRGFAYFRLDKLDEAIIDYNKAINLDSKYAFNYYGRGNVYSKLFKYLDAIDDYTKAIELDPKFARAFLMRGQIFARIGSKEEAINDFRSVKKIEHTYDEMIKRIANECELNFD